MKTFVILAASAVVLAGCVQQVPDSGTGVGFNDFAEFEMDRARREAQLGGQTGAGLPGGAVSSSELAAAGIGAQPSGGATGAATAPLAANAEISDEQDFGAVTSRESIESDAERRTRQAAAYQLIEARALPDRNGNAGPNIVQYALQAPNDLGEPVFNRSGFNAESRFARNCAAYRTPDAAQRDFITLGGPQRDRKGLDPDGDGFACGWDPQPFRMIASGN